MRSTLVAPGSPERSPRARTRSGRASARARRRGAARGAWRQAAGSDLERTPAIGSPAGAPARGERRTRAHLPLRPIISGTTGLLAESSGGAPCRRRTGALSEARRWRPGGDRRRAHPVRLRSGDGHAAWSRLGPRRAHRDQRDGTRNRLCRPSRCACRGGGHRGGASRRSRSALSGQQATASPPDSRRGRRRFRASTRRRRAALVLSGAQPDRRRVERDDGCRRGGGGVRRASPLLFRRHSGGRPGPFRGASPPRSPRVATASWRPAPSSSATHRTCSISCSAPACALPW